MEVLFIGFAILLVLRKVNLRRNELFYFMLFGIQSLAFFIEALRTDNLMLTEHLKMAQTISILLI
ncbi:prolipoprotein diacylglyceryltransferase [Bacillus thermophilus]|uniref:Prolipoprotein diacylglyceryltransferase n=1 Tax=Siminovitchia thermophila TaxID=1245522 RepID=A0ABS2R1A7_9BACI|nr:prolipoprotein diacylglyceryl transferase family protein [Siminovitchia thermophila]MBM7713422.1 prolipoprotein diacylglyceryltransferase [Siminovitchia thermophila]ONK21146.1 hypothetical protein BLX87_23855 [Bacillus sp. VT-16-64]